MIHKPADSGAGPVMNRRAFLAAAGAAALLGPLAGAAPAPAARRKMEVLLWCWDSRMTWDDEPGRILTRMAVSEQKFAYPKRPESFLVGFKRMVDYCERIGVRGIIVWGFLRDSHGGIPAAAELCRYAADHGVAILPGVGVGSYGGFYYDGEHPFNLDTYLRQHPERASRALEEHHGREVYPVLDPALEANQRWWRDGTEWMLEQFQIGGINFEMGDFIVNQSPGAAAARAALGIDADDNIKDMILATAGVLEHAHRIRPDGIFINATYRGLEDIRNYMAMPYVGAVHTRTVWQYNLRETIKREGFPEAFLGAPDHRAHAYLHWFNASTNTAGEDYTDLIGRVYPALRRLGFEFAGTYGEISAIGNELADRNYRAQVEA